MLGRNLLSRLYPAARYDRTYPHLSHLCEMLFPRSTESAPSDRYPMDRKGV